MTVIPINRTRPVLVALGELPVEQWPEGPFTVTISDPSGKLFEVTFPDYKGVLPDDAAIMGTAGIENANNLLVNILTGSLKVFAGAI